MSENDNAIQWIESRKERRTKDCHTVSYGVKCSRCGCFQDSPSRFCKDCGGRYDGELTKKSEKRFSLWRV